ncbi:flagellar hook capping protein [Georgenia satyanarayanai]|uniref:flagellar hook capping FlgD N-terminal domain-containing protein n=1 Tax=Georgenia satyanarayanai TaxID=860221 RepID=UPI002040E994|nr:flagellar hook capping FlgD N-terminal domain-containing protein [Georgenia satyanarayanai]MCM3661958.1 flagellar hook capping protein [Georgenia satyanarayanai]
MPIDPVSAGHTPPVSPPPSAPPPSGLKKDDFLQLLVTSLRYQDPSEPLSTSELMAQTTQLSTMEQLTELTTLTQEAFHLQMRSSATELVGKEVSYLDGDGVRHSGVVSAVDFSVTPPGAVVGDAVVPMNLLATVGALPPVTPPAGGTPTDPAA